MPRPASTRARPRPFDCVDAGEQVVGLLFAHAFEGEHGVALAVEREDVAEGVEQAGVGELVDDFLAHAVDVHLAAAGEVDDPFAELGRAFGVDAVAARFVGLAERLGSGDFFRLAAFLGGAGFFALDLGGVRFDFVDAALVVFDFDFAAALGAFLGRRHRRAGRRAACRVTTRTTCGMISPAFSMMTVSPMRMSLRRTSPRLWSEACCTVVPATNTGSMLARGVSLPDLPTCQSTLMSFVTACSAAYL